MENEVYTVRGPSFGRRVAFTIARLGLEASLVLAGAGIGSYIGEQKAIQPEPNDDFLGRMAVDIGNAGVQMKYAGRGALAGLGVAAVCEAFYWLTREKKPKEDGGGFY